MPVYFSLALPLEISFGQDPLIIWVKVPIFLCSSKPSPNRHLIHLIIKRPGFWSCFCNDKVIKSLMCFRFSSKNFLFFLSLLLFQFDYANWIFFWWNINFLTSSYLCSVAQFCSTLCNPLDCSLSAPPSMGFPRQEYWSGLPLPSPGIFLTQGSNLNLLHWQADSL